MKSFFSPFVKSAREFTKLNCLSVTAIFIAVSMILEMFSIDLQFVKINFAFLAIAVIGMLFGPTVGIFAGLCCDVVGFIAHPTGAFLPAYTLVAGLQGMIYGVTLYKGVFKDMFKRKSVLLFHVIIARLLDVIVINLLLNTALNLHYGFIPQEAFHTAILGRLAKNLIELAVDIPLLYVLMPVAKAAYDKTVSHGRSVRSDMR